MSKTPNASHLAGLILAREQLPLGMFAESEVSALIRQAQAQAAPADTELGRLREALADIAKKASESRSVTRRLTWIEGRAESALAGKDWAKHVFMMPDPKNAKPKAERLQGEVAGLRARLQSIYECTGCGAVTRNPERDLELRQKAGGISCCPERKMVLLSQSAAPVAGGAVPADLIEALNTATGRWAAFASRADDDSRRENPALNQALAVLEKYHPALSGGTVAGQNERALLQVLSAVQEQFNRFGESFPDGFDHRVFRWVDDAVASGAIDQAPAKAEPKCKLCDDKGQVCVDWESGAWALCQCKAEPGELDPKDLRIDTYQVGPRSGWDHRAAVGVRIIHLPTRIEVECSSERSQYANKEKALRELTALVAKARQVKP